MGSTAHALYLSGTQMKIEKVNARPLTVWNFLDPK